MVAGAPVPQLADMACLRPFSILAGAVLASAALPVAAQPLATTRVVACGAGDCLLVRGQRASPLADISINGRPVVAEGKRSWRVRLPIATVRDWSAPFARTLHVVVTDPTGGAERSEAVRLPIGLLGQAVELASLVVHAR